VLLRGVNDSVETLRELFHGLLELRIRPYYLYQCDPVLGTGHLRTPLDTGMQLLDALRGHTTGYALPTLVVDAPGGGGKIPLLASSIVGHESGAWTLRNWAGREYTYVDPGGER
jgi:lysine 2,3-aminomutase